jgi:hypothetical protein
MTPQGLLQKGDIIVHSRSSQRYEVLERLGNDLGYGVRIRAVGGTLDGINRLMLTAAYYLKHGWNIERKP